MDYASRVVGQFAGEGLELFIHIYGSLGLQWNKNLDIQNHLLTTQDACTHYNASTAFSCFESNHRSNHA